MSDVGQIKSYLGVTYRNELFKILKVQNKLRQHIPEMHKQDDEFEKSYEDLLVSLQHQEEMKTALRRALKRLSPKQREFLKLKFFDGLTYEQIAEKSGQTIKTVYNTTYEALKNLRFQLDRQKLF